MQTVSKSPPNQLFGSAREIAWIASGSAAMLTLPLWSVTGAPVWRLMPNLQFQALAWTGCWLAAAFGRRFHTSTSQFKAFAISGSILVAGFGFVYAALRMLPGVEISRVVAALSALLAMTLGLIPLVFGRIAAVLLAVIAFAGVATFATSHGSAIVAGGGSTHVDAVTSRYLLSMSVDKLSSQMYGGSIEAVRDGYLLASARGTFQRIQLPLNEGPPVVTALQIPSPLNRDAFAADQPNPSEIPQFRVTDIVIGPDTTELRLFAAHQYWNSSSRCLTMRVSVTVIDQTTWSASGWEPIYETRPCLTMAGGFTDNETGGRLAWREGRLLFTVGDHGFALDRVLAQDSSADYGKILELDLRGGRTIVSSGHRNPQGLAVARDGRIWSTEHGPRGGDEINLIRSGGNYGWPLVTHGTQYGLRYWPVDRDTVTGTFIEPAQAFSPSMGISAIVQLRDGPLTEWTGDFLVGTLVGKSLLRVTTDGDRVIATERIDVRHRVRDIAQGHDGRIVLWTDEGHLLTVAQSNRRPTGEMVYDQCAGCHGPDLRGTTQGPPLRALFDRAIGSSGFPFSPALRDMKGQWTKASLNAFLKNPEAYAKGTTMRFPGIADDADRRALIQFIYMSW